MHELSVTQSILEITLRHAAQAQAQRVTGIHLAIGQLASIVDDSVQFYWEMIAEDTLAAGAVLYFRRIPARAASRTASTRYALDNSDLACPHCGGAQVSVVAGTEFPWKPSMWNKQIAQSAQENGERQFTNKALWRMDDAAYPGC